MKILVTGGAGFIGSHLVEHLVNDGHGVIVLDDLSAGKISNLDAVKDKMNLKIGSVCDLNLVRLYTAHVDIVFHLATQCLVKGNEDPVLIHQVNDVGTYNVCVAAKEHGCKIVYVGSSEEYGPQTQLEIRENAPLKPLSLYGLTKVIGERYVQFFHDVYNVPAVIIRPFNTFGPRQREDAYAGVITSFLKRINSDKALIIFGDGEQTRDFSYVTDIVDGLLLLSQLKDGEIINLGSGWEASINSIARLVSIALGFSPSLKIPVEYAEPRVNDLRRLCADISRAKRYGYQPKVSLEEGLRKYVEWYASSHNRG